MNAFIQNRKTEGIGHERINSTIYSVCAIKPVIFEMISIYTSKEPNIKKSFGTKYIRIDRQVNYKIILSTI